MNHLSLVKHKSKYSADYYLTFAIDGEPLEVWLPKHDPQSEHDLIVSFPELYDEKETQLVWDRIYSTAPGWRTLVPLLVCPDDVDLICTVIVVEQFSNERQIQWCRFGLLIDAIEIDSPSVEWYGAIPGVIFDRQNFHEVLDEFREKENIVMYWD